LVAIVVNSKDAGAKWNLTDKEFMALNFNI
jgi:hypothetical protein